jgi:hypothetical protein
MKSFILTVFLTSFFIIGCDKEPKSADCTGTKEQLISCYQSKTADELSELYCSWAAKEASAKESNNDAARNEADDHTDAIKKVIRGKSDSDKSLFEDKTKGCKDH